MGFGLGLALYILNQLKQLWKSWNIRFLIMLSLLLQAFLILFSSVRKRTVKRSVIVLIWSAYLLADWVAAYVVGLISSIQSRSHPDNSDLLAFWAPFLLLHLGGPDSITSFSLEDNELWIRHLLSLILQVFAAAYVFYQSLPENKLLVPTILMFIAGIIKYAERTIALCFASLERFGGSALPKPDPGSEYEKIARRFFSLKASNLPTRVKIISEPDKKFWGSKFSANGSNETNELSLLRTAHGIFHTYKGLIVGHLFSPRERENSRTFFLDRTASEAFRLVEFELSLMYDVLHTKVTVVRSVLGCFFRAVCFSSVFGSFWLFYLTDKNGFHKSDIRLTYALLFGAMILEAVSVVMLVCSDWTLISHELKCVWLKNIALCFLRKKRWSGYVSQCNFISYCLTYRSNWQDRLLDSLGIGVYVDKIVMMRLSSSQCVDPDVKDFIYRQLKLKSKDAGDIQIAEKYCSQSGAWLLREDRNPNNFVQFRETFQKFQYAESLLLWHIASELCFNVKFLCDTDNNNSTSDEKKKTCKLLSDYMFSLLVSQTTIMAPVAGNWQQAYQDTCAEAKRFFRKTSLKEPSKFWENPCAEAKRLFRKTSSKEAAKFCEDLLGVETFFNAAAPVKGGSSKSLLFDACILAKQLRELKEARWELMNQVWVELMSYAAINCRPTLHAAQTSSGGELLTFIWLLMTHLGLGKHFYQQGSEGKMKMVIGK